MIGKVAPTPEQKKKYLKDGYKECDEDGKVKKAKKAKKKWKDLITGVISVIINSRKLLPQIWLPDAQSAKTKGLKD